jgi:tetratricopeptide (TPR) repeat protein
MARAKRIPSKTSQRTPSTAIWWSAAIIVLAGALAYSNSWSGPFVFDDELSVTYNASIRQLGHPVQVLFPEQDSSVAGRPLVNLSFAINYAIGGMDVRGYHAWNIALHLLCALVVFGVVRRTLQLPTLATRWGPRAIPLALATALIWMLHPLNSEVVNYLTQRTESMMALCYFLTMYAAIRSTSSRHAGKWEAAAVTACALGMTCKESMVTAPLMVVLYDRTFVFDSLKASLRARWRLYAGLAATWLLLAILVWSGPRGQSAGFSNDVTAWTYLLNQAVMITQYLRHAIWPRSLVINYGWPLPLTLGDVLPYASFVVCLLVVAAIILVLRPKVGFLLAWVVITLAPTSSVVPIATEVGAERRMYLPLVAIVALAVIGSTMLWDVLSRRLVRRDAAATSRIGALAGAIVLVTLSTALTLGTIRRNRDYVSGLSLIRTAVERWPTSVTRHMLGGALVDAGRQQEAIPYLRAAVPGAPRARYDLGIALFNDGKLEEAVEQLSALIAMWESPPAVHPRWQPPLRLDAIAAREIIGRVRAKQGRWPEAGDEFRKALALDPSNLRARLLLAEALLNQQLFGEAVAQYRMYLKEKPGDAEALGNLGIALISTGQLDEAVAQFRRAAEAAPDNGGVQRNLANALFDRGDIDQAAVHAQRAVALRPDDPSAHDLLGRALTLQGKLDEAAMRFERALQLNPADAEVREHLRRLQQLTGRRRPS